MLRHVTVRARLKEGTLLRMVGLIERRGFDVRGVSVLDGETVVLSVSPRGGPCSVENLCRQLEGLVDVRSARADEDREEAVP